MVRLFKHALAWVSSVLWPSTCPICFSIVSAQKPIAVCPECYKDLPFWQKKNVPLPSLHAHGAVDAFDAPFLYEGAVPQLIHQFKYGDTPEYASVLALYMTHVVHGYCQENGLSSQDMLYIPVPMHSWRLWCRQFNQSALLARHIAQGLSGTYTYRFLRRLRHTAPQRGKTKRQRLSNLKGAFWADETGVSGKDIVLVDDVWTTGSTAAQCAQVLKKAGAKSVFVCTLAYVNT